MTVNVIALTWTMLLVATGEKFWPKMVMVPPGMPLKGTTFNIERVFEASVERLTWVILPAGSIPYSMRVPVESSMRNSARESL